MGILRGRQPLAPVQPGVFHDVIKSMDRQVRSTFQARGAFSIQREFVHAETVVVNSCRVQAGLRLAVVQRRREASAPMQPLTLKSSLLGAEVVASSIGSPLSSDGESTRMVIRLSGENVKLSQDYGDSYDLFNVIVSFRTIKCNESY